ncbi:MAG: hypothetical protein GY725_21605 [bacterium]|nr:hypothetical protein [bacterium]
MSDRFAGAERLRDYFDLQLHFAERISVLNSETIAASVARFTNLHRRFGLGRAVTGEESEAWREFAARLARIEIHDERVEWAQEFFAHSSKEPPPTDQPRFGCFAYEPPNQDGVVRIHFENREVGFASGPLSSGKVDRRTGELQQLFAHLSEHAPSAKAIRGGSWLYHREAYRRLFPASFIDTLKEPERNPRFDGSSSWGQFLDHRECVRADLGAIFLQNLPRLDLAKLWRAFPLPALIALAPVEDFYRFYGIDRGNIDGRS